MRILIFITLFFTVLFGAASKISPIPLPKTYFIDLDIYPCGPYCLKEHLERGEIFSFLAKGKGTEAFAKEYSHYAALFHLSTPMLLSGQEIKIAVIADLKKLSPIVDRSIKTLYATLLRSNRPFSIEKIDISDQATIDQIHPDTLLIVLIPFSKRDILEELPSDKTIFVPTINAKLAQIDRSNIYYGGIDYEQQLEHLLQYSNQVPTIFYLSDSQLSQKLTDMIVAKRNDANLIDLKNRAQNLRYILKSSSQLFHGDIFLNTPLVQSALVLTQLTLYKIAPHAKLSTQINFHPKLFALTQELDRHNLIIANSILHRDKITTAATAIYNVDLHYDWIDYAQIIGVESLMTPQTKSSNESFLGNQIQYDIGLFRYSKGGFHQIFLENSGGSL